jgi:hypothetical protein
MGIYIKDNMLKFFGILILIFGCFLLLLGGMMWFEGDPRYWTAGRAIVFFSLIFNVPGILLLINARRIHKVEVEVQRIAELIMVYRRISIDALSSKTGFTPAKIEGYIGEALAHKLISGKIDRTTNEFYTDDAVSADLDKTICPGCGKPFPDNFIKGDTIKCPSCGNTY